MRRDDFWARKRLLTEIVEAALREVRPIYKPQTPAERRYLYQRALDEMLERRQALDRAIDALRAFLDSAEAAEVAAEPPVPTPTGREGQ